MSVHLTPSQEKILHTLLNREEGSPDTDRAITVTVNEKNFPEYFEDANPEAVRAWEEDVLTLVAWKWIEAEKGKGADGHRLVKLRLNRSKKTVITPLVGRWNLTDWQEEMTAIYERFIQRANAQPGLYPTGWKECLLRGLERIERLRPPHEKRTEIKAELELILEALAKIICPVDRVSYGRSPLTWRQFATLEFGDSKKLNPLKPKIARMLYEIIDSDFSSFVPGDGDLFADFGIETKEELLQVSGPFLARSSRVPSFKVDGNQWRPFAAIPRRVAMEHALEWDFSAASGVLTIENEEVFQAWSRDSGRSTWVGVYTGGFPSRFKVEFLKNIPRDLPFHHWGDLDVGGIQIFRYLEKALDRKLLPFTMEPELLEKYRSSTQPLELAELQRLESIRRNLPADHSLTRLVSGLIRERVKLEQEATLPDTCV